MKNKNGGGEPGIDSHVILWHNDITAIIANVVKQLCSYDITTENLSCKLVGETSARFKQQRRQKNTECESKALPTYCYHGPL